MMARVWPLRSRSLCAGFCACERVSSSNQPPLCKKADIIADFLFALSLIKRTVTHSCVRMQHLWFRHPSTRRRHKRQPPDPV
ncbi:hypothetical protein FO269_15590 [Lacticaseibacillus paracasei]|nr:hypothetical protein FO269_15590 [Lacticaseibacillus paracasei]